MARAFDSSGFFTDEYFAGDGTGTQTGITATIAAVDYDCIFNDGFDPVRMGKLAGRPGHWATIYLPMSQLATKPDPQTKVVIDAVTWRVDSSASNGDLWEIWIVTDQRKG